MSMDNDAVDNDEACDTRDACHVCDTEKLVATVRKDSCHQQGKRQHSLQTPMPKHYTSHHKNLMQVFCANCGALGHMYRSCNQPIISYGVICYKIDKGIPKYLMVQRKDSLAYVEFVRGKYNLNVKTYILDLFSLMTEEERQNIISKPFDTIWQEMWCKKICDESRNFGKEFKEAHDKFMSLKVGYYIKDSNDEIEFFNLQQAYDTTRPKFTETEWGFPKGRRNINEDDVSCALREFKEETGVNPKYLKLCNSHIKPFDEVFSGSNKVRYKHVYYIARLTTEIKCFTVNPNNKQQCKEIRSIQWFTYEEAQDKLRDYNIERKELLKRLNTVICRDLRKHVGYNVENTVIQST